jgi:hypothetical protein
MAVKSSRSQSKLFRRKPLALDQIEPAGILEPERLQLVHQRFAAVERRMGMIRELPLTSAAVRFALRGRALMHNRVKVIALICAAGHAGHFRK